MNDPSQPESRVAADAPMYEIVKVEAIVRPFALDDVKERLTELGVGGMTVSEVRGFGRTGGKREVHRGSAYVIDFVPKLKLEIVVPARLAEEVVQALCQVAATSRIRRQAMVMRLVSRRPGSSLNRAGDAPAAA